MKMKTKKYDLIAIGTGSAMTIVEAMLGQDPEMKVAVIDRNDPGGICLTRGCIPTKILLYPAELVRMIEKANEFGIDVHLEKIDFNKVMERMHSMIDPDIDMIRQGLSESPNFDYYHDTAEFIKPYTLKVGDTEIFSEKIILCTGSRPHIPNIKGIDTINYHTSDSILEIKELPKSLAIIGGGYIAAEYGHFFASMGTIVTIIGRNRQFLPQEEKEVSTIVRWDLKKQMEIVTNHEVIEVEKQQDETIRLYAKNKETGETRSFLANEILVATGRSSEVDILHPEKTGVEINEKGWIIVNEHLETSQKNIWALGDATGMHQFKHVANHEAKVLYFNMVLNEPMRVDYHAVPHAVFTHPEVASVGMGEAEAIDKYGIDKILIGLRRYSETAKGQAMNAKGYFVKVIVNGETNEILGAHIVGPHASILIQEIINLMYTPDRSPDPIREGMHIHPALNEVVEGAFFSLMPAEQYRHMLEHQEGHGHGHDHSHEHDHSH